MMPHHYSGHQRAAIFLLTLPPQICGSIIAQMMAEEQNPIMIEITKLPTASLAFKQSLQAQFYEDFDGPDLSRLDILNCAASAIERLREIWIAPHKMKDLWLYDNSKHEP